MVMDNSRKSNGMLKFLQHGNQEFITEFTVTALKMRILCYTQIVMNASLL
jgi:hypothetical protein